ncbi:MAG: hypothetical protein A2023_07245 [Sulfuricurvum sp. GWF2_44_89]|nr:MULTISPECIES: ThiF family adenylyltransferase [Sulfuricurvum]OHD78271.1 MAG: hypothetical protein A2023_07245 [Sulfuricurvum sp. GWF2_44_89]OHD91578.1 MAG: hypothetical protein A2517_07185 [Sulfuricurvum sp. RIFOXYD12_FULL_44_77]OHD94134.1 MAG: hypothetical protein A2552_01680 [Sulfuricurvum sp. RIFOXYD2_FULL_44_160]
MSLQPTNPNITDLDKLLADGYNAYMYESLLIVQDIPYVNERKEVDRGVLVSTLTVSGNTAVYQRNAGKHVIHFQGQKPCDDNGKQLDMIHTVSSVQHANHITTSYSFSRKPPNDYGSEYEKMIGYITALMSPALVIDPTATAKSTATGGALEWESVFNYIDTNSERAHISEISQKLMPYHIGIIGVGGTGSYILDSIAKTPVQSIHLFDSDIFYNHNAFRAPGAPSKEILEKRPTKVEYLKGVYSNMHKNIEAHPVDIDENTITMLGELNFVFVAVDKGSVKKLIFDYLESKDIPYVDVGMGVQTTPQGTILGEVRTVAVTNEKRKKHRSWIGQVDPDEELYESNIQIAELNSINAAMAVIMWKKHAKFYNESTPVGMTTFTIDTLQQGREIDDDA